MKEKRKRKLFTGFHFRMLKQKGTFLPFAFSFPRVEKLAAGAVRSPFIGFAPS